jgi:hypothetical protein
MPPIPIDKTEHGGSIGKERAVQTTHINGCYVLGHDADNAHGPD